MIKNIPFIFQGQSQPLIRHCWVYTVYKKKLSKISYKEKFVNFLIKDGKKTKAYKLFNKTGILIKRKIAHIDKIKLFFEHNQEVSQRIKQISIQINRISQKVEKRQYDDSSLSKKSTLNNAKTGTQEIVPLSPKPGKSLTGIVKKNKGNTISDRILKKKGEFIESLAKKTIKDKKEMVASSFHHSVMDPKNSFKAAKKRLSSLSKNSFKETKKRLVSSPKNWPKGAKEKQSSWSNESFKENKRKLLSFNELLMQAIDNVKPNLEVRKVRVGGSTYLVPAIIPKNRQQTLAIKWLIGSAKLRKRGTKGSFAENLANELMDALIKQGQARQKRDELHKIAEANRAYTRYRWW